MIIKTKYSKYLTLRWAAKSKLWPPALDQIITVVIIKRDFINEHSCLCKSRILNIPLGKIYVAPWISCPVSSRPKLVWSVTTQKSILGNRLPSFFTIKREPNNRTKKIYVTHHLGTNYGKLFEAFRSIYNMKTTDNKEIKTWRIKL